MRYFSSLFIFLNSEFSVVLSSSEFRRQISVAVFGPVFFLYLFEMEVFMVGTKLVIDGYVYIGSRLGN